MRRDEKNYSASGLLCELYRQAHPDAAKWDGAAFHWKGPLGGWSFTTILLPEMVAEWAGLSSTDPVFNWSIKYSSLRPEDERNSAQGLREADRFKDSGDPVMQRIYTSAKKRRENWESYKADIASGSDSLLSIQNALELSFEQTAVVLANNLK